MEEDSAIIDVEESRKSEEIKNQEEMEIQEEKEEMQIQDEKEEQQQEEMEETQDIRVLVVMPDTSQRLITLEDVPIFGATDVENYVVHTVEPYLNEKCDRLELWAINDPDLPFDYFIEILPVIDTSKHENVLEESFESLGVNVSHINDFLQSSNNDNINSSESYYNQTIYEKNDDNDFEIDVGNEVEIGIETENFSEIEVQAVETIDSYSKGDEEDVEVDVDGTEELEFESKEPEEDNHDAEHSTIDLLDSPVSRRQTRLYFSKHGVNVLTIYPAPPAKSGISINSEDYKCLSESQFLNDVIIDFYLKYLMNEVLSQADQQRTHIFSSHFFTRLAKPYEKNNGMDVTIGQKRHAGVERWTKNVNVFEKDFVIVPVNESCHWYLAIICFPNLVGHVGGHADQADCFLSGDELQKPCILIFDSLSGIVKSRAAIILRQYLHYEYLAKMKEENIFTFETIRTIHPSVPVQSNATDCGLYLLQFVEQFFKDPIKDFTLPFRDLSDWFKRNVIIRKREEIASLISKLACEFHEGKKITLPCIKLPSLDEALSSDKESDWLTSTPKEDLLYNHQLSPPISRRRKKLDPTQTLQPVSATIKKHFNNNYNFEEGSVGELLFDDEVEQPKPLRKSKALNNREISNILEKNEMSSDNESYEIFEPKKPEHLKVYTKPRSNHSKLAELAKSITVKKEKKKTERTKRVLNRSLKPRISSGNDLTKESLFLASQPTDKFYALSFEALKNDSSISPNISFAKFKKLKQ